MKRLLIISTLLLEIVTLGFSVGASAKAPAEVAGVPVEQGTFTVGSPKTVLQSTNVVTGGAFTGDDGQLYIPTQRTTYYSGYVTPRVTQELIIAK